MSQEKLVLMYDDSSVLANLIKDKLIDAGHDADDIEIRPASEHMGQFVMLEDLIVHPLASITGKDVERQLANWCRMPFCDRMAWRISRYKRENARLGASWSWNRSGKWLIQGSDTTTNARVEMSQSTLRRSQIDNLKRPNISKIRYQITARRLERSIKH